MQLLLHSISQRIRSKRMQKQSAMNQIQGPCVIWLLKGWKEFILNDSVKQDISGVAKLIIMLHFIFLRFDLYDGICPFSP